MNRRLRIQHSCEYHYPYPLQYSARALRLTPRRDSSQHTLHWTIHAPGRRAEQVDAHGNITHLLTLETAHRHLEVVVTGLIETSWSEQALPHEGPLSPLAYLAPTALTRPDAALLNLADTSRPQNGATWEWITRLGRGVRELHPGVVPSQDIAHAFLACCRSVDVWSAPQDGWIALDVDRVEPARSHHCRLAVGRDYLDAAPVRCHMAGETTETLRIRDQ